MTVDLHSKYAGAMLGAALGDAIGELAFRFQGRESLLDHIDQVGKLTYTDDTAMSLALAGSLVETDDVDPQALGEAFRRYYHQEPWRGYGPGPPRIFSLVEKQGLAYCDAARTLYEGQGSYGNGAAMRIAPVGLRYHDSPDLAENARASARVTHAHPVGIDGAAVLAKAVAKAVTLNDRRPFSPALFLKDLSSFCDTSEMGERLEWIAKLIEEEAPVEEAVSRLGIGVAVYESVPFAIYCFLRHPHTYTECLLCAISQGGDRDTLGAMAGAVSGAYLGMDALPCAWLEKLENHSHIEALAHELVVR